MIITKPDYYDEFKCVADKCKDTCCAGWQIVIDDDSLAKYENILGKYSKNIMESIDFDEHCFKQDKNKRCAHLNENNLCDLYINMSEEYLCDTCKNYPRHIEEFENIREYNLSISCPEVARIILSKESKVTYCATENDEYEEFEDFDVFLHSYLEDARSIITDILQDREYPIGARLQCVLVFAKKMQFFINEGEMFSIPEIFEEMNDKSKRAKMLKDAQNKIECFCDDERFSYEFSKSVFSRLYELERLYDDWEDMLDKTWETLYDQKLSGYNKIRISFDKNFKFDKNILFEQYLIYFIHTYFCGAVYDAMVLSKVEMAAAGAYAIHEMIMAKWFENEDIDMEAIERTVYRFSRELEHSDTNLLLFEDIVMDIFTID